MLSKLCDKKFTLLTDKSASTGDIKNENMPDQ